MTLCSDAQQFLVSGSIAERARLPRRHFERIVALMPAKAEGAQEAQNRLDRNVVFLMSLADELRRKVPVGE